MTPLEIVMSVGVWASTCLLGIVAKLLWEIKSETNELWEIHLGPKALDDNLTPRWYVKQSLIDSIKSLTIAIEKLQKSDEEAHRKLLSDVRDMKREMKRYADGLDSMG